MTNQSFYRNVILPDTECRQQIDDEPLVVNCAGYCDFSDPFHTWKRDGRPDYYLQVVTHGTLRIWVGNQLCQMDAGDFLITKPKTPYRYYLPENEALGYLWVHFTGFYVGRLLARLQMETGQIYTTNDCIPRLTERFEFLFGEFTNRQRGFDDACASRLTQILVCLSRATSINSHTAERKLPTLAWLHAHFTENVPIEEIAAMEHLSESRYRSVFRRQTGLSPSEYRIALRLQHACELLTTSSRSITEISNACGYGDVLYFIRLFKQKIGVPPGEYRTRSQAEQE